MTKKKNKNQTKIKAKFTYTEPLSFEKRKDVERSQNQKLNFLAHFFL